MKNISLYENDKKIIKDLNSYDLDVSPFLDFIK